VIEEFLDSWPLFQNAYLSGWFAGLLLAVLGVYVVARNQIFLGAAVAQASTFGIAVGLCLSAAGCGAACGFAHLDSDVLPVVLAVVCSVLAALLTAREDGEGRESREALTGWVFLASSSLALLLLSHSPHGSEEVHRLLASSLLGAQPWEVWLYAGLALFTLVVAVWARGQLALLAMDPVMASAVGLRTRTWTHALAVWLGLSVGLAIRTTGILYAFGCLVLPTLAARGFCREVRSLFWMAPLMFLLCAAPGFVAANHYDYPPAQVTVALLAAVTTIGWAVRAMGRRK
jgi:zinc/manganese transport system permease protein